MSKNMEGLLNIQVHGNDTWKMEIKALEEFDSHFKTLTVVEIEKSQEDNDENIFAKVCQNAKYYLENLDTCIK